MAERITAQKMKFSIKNLFCKCEKTLNGRNLLKKSLMENFIFCAANLYFHPKSFKSIFKLNSKSGVNFTSWSGNSVNPAFPNNNITKTIKNVFIIS